MIKALSADLASIWDASTCWLSKRVLKRRFLESGLTKIFTVCNLGKTLPKTMVLLFKRFKIRCRFQKCNKKLRKTFSFFRQFHLNWELQILAILNTILGITSECVNKSPLRFHVTLGETFFKSTSLRMMKRHDKSALMEISQVFWTLWHVECQSVFWNGAF